MDQNCRYDIKGFTADLGLPVAEIADLYTELIAEFNADIAKLKILLADHDWEAIHLIMHEVKGIAVNYRITDVYQRAAFIDDRLKRGDCYLREQELSDFFVILETAILEITKYFEQKAS